ncbi:MAG: STAS domain-containing protein [bacterium]
MAGNLVEIKKKQNIGVIVPEREIVFENVDLLKQEVKDKIRKEGNIDRLIVDLKLVTYLDSAGIGFLLSLFKYISERQGKLVLSNINGKVKRIIELTKLDDVIEVYEDTEQALEDLRGI